MKEKIKYQDWPEMVKITTALSNRNFLIKNHKVPLILGYIVLSIGGLDLIFRVVQSGLADVSNLLSPLGVVIVGLFNIGGSSTLKWIADNSSWEERFENTSSTSHKLISIIPYAILFLCVYVIIMYR